MDQCQNLIKLCDSWNQKDCLKKPEFQIDLAHRIFENLLEWDFNGHRIVFKSTGLEQFWYVRLLHLYNLQRDKKLDLSEDAYRYLELLVQQDPTAHLFLNVYFSCYHPLTEEEEKYLIERRKKYEEMVRVRQETCLANSKKTLPKLKRGTKARAAREAAIRKKRQKMARRKKLEMRSLMIDTLKYVASNWPRDDYDGLQESPLVLANLAHNVFQFQPRRRQPVLGPISFKIWYNLDLLIQLINVGAVLVSDKPSTKELMEELMAMKKEDSLTALRQLRDMVRRDPKYKECRQRSEEYNRIDTPEYSSFGMEFLNHKISILRDRE